MDIGIKISSEMDRFQSFQGCSSSYWRFVGTILVSGSVVFASCSRNSRPDNRILLTDPPKARAALAPAPGLPNCPGELAAELAETHKVVLTWNPSSSSSGPNDRSIGYCLYRSNSEITVDRRRDCIGCQAITPTPIIGTSCVDNFGDGSKPYFYAAIAINFRGKESSFSNRIRASLAATNGKSSTGAAPSVRSCRNPATPQAVAPARH